MKRTLLFAVIAIFSAQNAVADFYDGVKAFQKEDYQRAYDEWLPLAEDGVAQAQSNLGLMYDVGTGVKQDFAKAIQWYQKAAEQNNVNAQYNLAVIYYQGKGVAVNYQKGFVLLQAAAKEGHSSAQNDLGWVYENGVGIDKDFAKAEFWYQLALENKHSLALENLTNLRSKMASNAEEIGHLPAGLDDDADISWLNSQPDSHFTMQLASSESEVKLRAMVVKNAISGAKVIPQKRDGRLYYVVLLESKEDRKELKKLAEKVKQKWSVSPWIRQISGVKKLVYLKGA
ncbi:SEL1-like repeat protein [Thiomicrorhabdus sp. 6S2-11]|uniref:SEL1-like repeat protein n=1 Tax=Thiomicrorhabdus marina TaxID=2818442 RepID=A0ABS3Q1Z0_9GAMM|nr:SPOR domain-containing protein [Thiomicrorhabdus marina]MBO1926332.1 SEL1-like repeat protein [Thiomicrorhabdus marina]